MFSFFFCFVSFLFSTLVWVTEGRLLTFDHRFVKERSRSFLVGKQVGVGLLRVEEAGVCWLRFLYMVFVFFLLFFRRFSWFFGGFGCLSTCVKAP